MDEEMHKLQALYGKAKIKVGLEMAVRLRKIYIHKLYKQLDEGAYPSFSRYVESLGMKYQTAMELIGIYSSYVLAGGYTVDELSQVPYHALVVWKPYLFKKENDVYLLDKPKKEADKIMSSANVLTIEDTKQERRDKEAGTHKHVWARITNDVCQICGLKEFKGKQIIEK